jgi:hypothetical protein
MPITRRSSIVQKSVTPLSLFIDRQSSGIDRSSAVRKKTNVNLFGKGTANFFNDTDQE